MLAFARLLQYRSTLVMAASIPVGLALQDLAALLRPYVIVLSVITIWLSLLRLDWAALARGLRRPGYAVAIVAWTLLGCPALAYLALRWALPAESALLSGITLVAAAPPVMSATAYALMLGADAALLLLVAVPGTALVPVTLPLFLTLVPGLDTQHDLPALALRLLLIVAASFGGAAIVKMLARPAALARHAVSIDAAMVFFIFLTGVAVTSGVTREIAERPGLVAVFLAAALLLNLALQVAGWLVFHRARGLIGLSAALGSGNRNMAMLLAAVTGRVPPDVELFVVVAQLPLYLLPVVVKPVYSRLGRQQERMSARRGRRRQAQERGPVG